MNQIQQKPKASESPKTGLLLCGHGSRSEAAVREFANMAKQLPPHLAESWPVEFGYLEFANPVIRLGLDRLRKQGCKRILAVPGMLFAAMHAKNDLPAVLNSYALEHDVEVLYGRELGVDPKMIAAAADRITAAVEAANAAHGELPVSETCLVVIGRGASDPDANSNVSKITRLLWEGLGFGWAETGYSGVTFPLVEPCLERVAMLGFRRIVVFPYFLFSGILIDRIYGFADMAAERFPEIEFVKAGYLNDHRKVLETFADRASEILTGETAMNCSMCKYRTQVLGFESEVGSPQASHHHHVEGQGASAPGSNVSECELCESFCTGACRLPSSPNGKQGEHAHRPHHHGHDHFHNHHHEHPPYPHSQHPLGPESARRHLPHST